MPFFLMREQQFISAARLIRESRNELAAELIDSGKALAALDAFIA